jgi:hypothetical protein
VRLPGESEVDRIGYLHREAWQSTRVFRVGQDDRRRADGRLIEHEAHVGSGRKRQPR